jgi:hypothetical protein
MQVELTGAWLSLLCGVTAMNTYRVERAGTKYQVIEELPDRGTFEVVGFPTEVDARAWLGDFLRMTGHVEPDPTDD